MSGCDHVGHRVYTRRIFANGTLHFCVQCLKCLDVVKLPEHDYRPFIRADEIPAGHAIYEFTPNGGDK